MRLYQATKETAKTFGQLSPYEKKQSALAHAIVGVALTVIGVAILTTLYALNMRALATIGWVMAVPGAGIAAKAAWELLQKVKE